MSSPSITLYSLPEIARSYPKPVFTMLPNHLRSVKLDSSARGLEYHSRFLEADVINTYKGRYAIYHALEAAGRIRKGDSILMPAYHCPSMIEPALMRHLKPVFYPLDDKLNPDLSAIVERTSNSVIAILVTHFFGRVFDFSKVVEWAHGRDILVIEDCAHAFGHTIGQVVPGIQGDMAIASSAKFFPGGHGGRLVLNIESDQPALKSAGLLKEVKDVKSLLEPVQSNSLKIVDASNVKDKIDRIDLDKDLQPHQIKCQSNSLHWCNREDAKIKNTRVMNFVIRLIDKRALVARRRHIYERLSKIIDARPDMSLLYGDYQPDIPYVVPVILRNPQKQFSWLKYARIPLWRWEEVAISDCKFTAQHKNSLIQLPCHQNMTDSQLDWLIKSIQIMPINGG